MNRVHYCPIGEPQRQFGCFVTGAGREKTLPGEPYPHDYHSSDYFFTWEKGRKLVDWEYQLLFIRSGSGVIEFERDKPIRLSPGCVIILHPGEWHRYRPDRKTGWEETYIGIGGDILSRIVAKPFLPQVPTVIKLTSFGKFDHDLMSLVDEIQTLSAERPYYLAAKTLMLLTTLFESARNQSRNPINYSDIRRATIYIAHHLGQDIDFPALAQRVGLGYSLFRKKFHAYTDMAPLEYLIALRIRRARHLLTSTSTPVAQIAQETGFKSPTYFSRFFREATGLSPRQCRR